MNKKMNADIAAKIIEAIKPLTHIPHISAGGCGVVAYYIADTFLKAGYPASIIELRYHETDMIEAIFGVNNGQPESFEENVKNMHIASVNHASPDKYGVRGDDHFCVKSNDFYFDCNAFCETKNQNEINLKESARVFGEVPINDFEYITFENRTNVWNTMYDTSNNKKVEAIIKDGLSFLTPKKQPHVK